MTFFTFTIDTDTCPSCGCDLSFDKSIDVDGTACFVDRETGRVTEDEVGDTDLVLDYDTPGITCSQCEADLCRFLVVCVET